MKTFQLDIPDNFVPEDGDVFQAVMDALEMADISGVLTEILPHDGLSSYFVTYTDDGNQMVMQFWAEDVAHAGEQMENAVADCTIDLIETEDEYNTRNDEN